MMKNFEEPWIVAILKYHFEHKLQRKRENFFEGLLHEYLLFRRVNVMKVQFNQWRESEEAEDGLFIMAPSSWSSSGP